MRERVAGGVVHSEIINLLKGCIVRIIRLPLAGALVATVLVLTPASNALATSAPTLAQCQSTINSLEYHRGTLTAATDLTNGVYEPWFVNNKPSNGQGYEAAVVYGVAKELGITASHVNWVAEPFDASYTPGFKHFDFDINEISYTAERAKAVSFSTSYYNVTQSIVTLKTSKMVKAHSPSELKTYLYGDQIGTTGLSYIQNYIKPTRAARVYPTLQGALTALAVGQIDAVVLDTPDGQYAASAEVTNAQKKLIATQIGQFPSTGEHYGMLFAKNSKMVACVNTAIQALAANGTLAALQKKWLSIYNAVPSIRP